MVRFIIITLNCIKDNCSNNCFIDISCNYCKDSEQPVPVIVKDPPAQLIATEGTNVVIVVKFRIVGQLSNYNWVWVKNTSRLYSSTNEKTYMKTTLRCMNETISNGSKEFISQLTLKSLGHNITGYYFFAIANQYGKTVASKKTKVRFSGTLYL